MDTLEPPDGARGETEKTDHMNSDSESDMVDSDATYIPDSCSDDSEIFPALQKYEKCNPEPASPAQTRPKRWNKKHACLFCASLVIKMPRHLEVKHSNELQVAQILSLPIKSVERRQAWNILVNEGDFKHNYSVLERKEGLIIPKYKQKTLKHSDQYLPCPGCKAMYGSKLLQLHAKKCPARQSGQMKKSTAVSKLMLPVQKGISKSFHENVLIKLCSDEIAKIVINDALIMKMGQRAYAKRDVEEHIGGHICSKMREMARLLLAFRSQSQIPGACAKDFFSAEHFDNLLEAVKTVSCYSDETHKFQKPSLALKLGYSLQKCCSILKAEAVKAQDTNEENRANQFLTLFNGNWNDVISSCASQSLERQKFNKPRLLPSCENVNALLNYVKKIGQETTDYATLAKCIICEVTLFNRKRGGEVQRLKLDEYRMGLKNNSEVDPEVEKKLTLVEKRLVKKLFRIELRGKLNRRVAILLTTSMVDKIESLVVLREKAGITSPYLFVTPKGTRPFRGSDVIKAFSKGAGINNPDLFTWTNLRKHVATMSQALEISETDQDMLAEFLGHDIRVHKTYYRLPLDILQKAKVAKILLAVNSGLPCAEGEVQLDDELPDDDADSEASEDEEDSDRGDQFEDEEDGRDASSTEQLQQKPTDVNQLALGKTSCVTNEKNDSSQGHHEKRQELKIIAKTNERGNGSPSSSNQTLRPRRKFIRRPWNEQEVAVVMRCFSSNIQMGIVPQKDKIDQLLENEQNVLSNRTWRNIKDYVYNKIKQQK